MYNSSFGFPIKPGCKAEKECCLMRPGCRTEEERYLIWPSSKVEEPNKTWLLAKREALPDEA